MHTRFSLPRTSRGHSADMTAPLPAQQDSPFRRPGKLRIALVGVGAFLLAICLLLLFYIGPQLIAAPVSFNQTYILKATDASDFNAGTLQTVQGANLTYTLTVRSDPRSSSHTNAVWNSSAVLTDPVNKATVNVVVQRAAFNRRTEELLNCCGASLNGDTRVKQTGLGLLWPVDTSKGTHQVFDPNSGHAFPASYVRTVQVNGLTTYEFVQHVPPTVAQQMSGIPSSLLGLPGSSSSVVVADRYWSATNTFFVDPRTGIIINEEVKGQSVLRGPGGQGLAGGGQHGSEDDPSHPEPARRAGQQERHLDHGAPGGRPDQHRNPRRAADRGGVPPPPRGVAARPLSRRRGRRTRAWRW